MANFSIVAQQVAILFLLMGVGVLARRMRLVDEAGAKGMTNVLILLVTPCLIVDVFDRPFDASMLGGLVTAFATAAAVHLASMALACGVFRRGPYDAESVLRVGTVFSNAGFMGVPLEQAILGEEGVFYGISYVVVFNLLMWSWGLSLMRRSRLAASRMMFVNPGTVGVALGLAVFLLPWKPPAVLRESVHMMAQLNTPLAMIVIGFYLAGARLGRVMRSPLAHLAAFLRLVAVPVALTFALLPLAGRLDRTLALALVIPASAPTAAMVSMFAGKYGRDVDLSVALVSGTTLLSAVTMPVVIALAMHLL